jgi:hypothetical protein
VIDPGNPFKFGNWLVTSSTPGGINNGDDVELGRTNYDGDGQTTIVGGGCNQTAALAGINAQGYPHGVGVFGRSFSNDWSIGVAGESSKGCGVYGIATDENPTGLDESHGIGVVGRSVGGQALDDISLERIIGEPIGVLGQSTDGTGVRGHGGPMLTLNQPGPIPPLKASPGGVFSSGRLKEEKLGAATSAQWTSHDSLPQVRLVPSRGDLLPTIGQVGDLFLTSPSDVGARLWICTAVNGTVPQWQRVHMDASRPGGMTAS